MFSSVRFRLSALLCLIAATLFAAPTIPPPGPPPDDLPVVEGTERELHVDAEALDAALREAADQFRPVLLLFTFESPSMQAYESKVLDDPRVAAVLENYAFIRCRTDQVKEVAARFRIRGVPTWLRLDPNGLENGRRTGSIEPDELLEFLERLYAGERPAEVEDGRDRELRLVLEAPQRMTEGDWLAIAAKMAEPATRKSVLEVFREADPYPAAALVGLLEHSWLPMRLAALDLLEDRVGDSFGFDPWEPLELQTVALGDWQRWAEDPEAADTGQRLIDEEMILGLLTDLLSDDLAREQRGRRGLLRIGEQALPAIERMEAASSDLTAGARGRLREMRVAIALAKIGALDPGGTAQRLVFGDVNSRIAAMQQIAAEGEATVPILRESLASGDALEREAAVEALTRAGGTQVADLLLAHVESEEDPNTLHVLFRQLTSLKTEAALAFLADQVRHEEEDLAVTALEGLRLANAKSFTEAMAGALEDPRWRVRVAALDALAATQGNAHADAIRARLQDDDPFVRISAIQTAGRLRLSGLEKEVETLFENDPAARPAIIATLSAADAPVPDSILKQLEQLPAEAWLQIMGSVESIDATTLPLVRLAAAHANPDVSLSAVRIAAQHGINEKHPAFGILIDALRSGDERMIRTVVESIDLRAYQLRRIDAMVSQARFGESGSEVKPATAKGVMGKVISAYRGSDEGATLNGLRAALLDVTRQTNDDRLRAQGAIALVVLGDPRGLLLLDESILDLEQASRLRLAEGIQSNLVDAMLPIGEILLRDDSAAVRAEAASALGGNAFFEPRRLVIAALNDPDHPLQPIDLTRTNFNILPPSEVTPWRAQLLEWATNADNETPLRVIGTVELGNAWSQECLEPLQALSEDPDPFVRRAAAIVLAQHAEAAFLTIAPRLAEDSHPLVRETVMAPRWAGGRDWTTYLNAKATDRNYFHESNPPSPPEDLVALWENLAADEDPTVRYRAMTALIRAGRPIDAPQYVRLAESQNSYNHRHEIERAFSRPKAEVPESYEALLALLDSKSSAYRKGTALFQQDSAPSEAAEPTPAKVASTPSSPEPTPVEPTDIKGPEPIQLVYFYKPGCHDCEEVEAMLARVQESLPGLQVERFDINKHRSMELNEWLAEERGVPSEQRLVAPSLYSARDYLIRHDISEERIASLALSSRGAALDLPEENVRPASMVEAATAIAQRYESINPALIASAGLLDGLNPCAFATIIFLLSYLQVAKRTPREILQIGLAYLAGVFCTYFVLGLGLTEVVSRLVVFRQLAMVMNLAMGLFALVLAVLSVRDAVLCLRGRMKEMTLQLPESVKQQIHGVIRSKARHHRFVLMAFGVGAFISVLELACTGQVYAPTILYMLQSGEGSAVGYLLLYNIAFIVPLAAVFAAAFYGMTSEMLIQFLRRHAAWVKFGLAGLFLVLALVLIGREI